MWTGSHRRGPQASWYKGREKQKSKDGRQRQLQDLLTHDIHQPSAVKPATGLFRLKQAGQVSVTGIPVDDHAQLRTVFLTLISGSPGTWRQDKGRRNSPLLPPNEKLLLHEDHILQGYPDQQGSGGDIGNRGGHDQPVGRGAVTRRLRRCFDPCHDDGKPLHDDKEWHAQACKLQHLAQGKLQHPPRAHGVAVQKKKKKGGRQGLLSQWGDPCPSEGWSGLGPVHCLSPLAFSTHHSPLCSPNCLHCTRHCVPWCDGDVTDPLFSLFTGYKQRLSYSAP